MTSTDPQITVLMPTADRVEYVSRALAFLKKNFSNQPIAQFRMLDGSTDENASLNEQACKMVGMEYCRFRADILPYERIHVGLSQVETPLVCLLPDDDFFNPTGFLKAVDFMQQHSEYSAAHGDYIGFRINENKPGWRDWWPIYKQNQNFEQADSVERLFNYFGAYTPIHYAVHRTSLLTTGFAEALSHVDPLEYKFAEYLIAAIVMSQGKVKKLDQFYMCRQGGNSTPYARTTMAQQMFDPCFSDRYARFKRCLIRYLSQHPTLSEEQLFEAIDVIFGHFLGKKLQTGYLRNQLSAIRHFTPRSRTPEATPTSDNAPIQKTRPKDLLFYLKRTRQALRHPKTWIPKSYKHYSPKYAPVLDFLQAYLHDPKGIGLDLKISNTTTKG
jgi:glycosyltransferase domain-containing protein